MFMSVDSGVFICTACLVIFVVLHSVFFGQAVSRLRARLHAMCACSTVKVRYKLVHSFLDAGLVVVVSACLSLGC